MNTPSTLCEKHAEHLEWLCRAFTRNKFIPVPPAERVFIGDGDFRAIGAEFLKHFVRFGGLAPHHKVLEIGCGIGRMALPITQWLDPETGSYDGIDIVQDGIQWCREEITPRYGNFKFHRLDARNDLYNPNGRIESHAVRLPFRDGTYDFIFLTSVVTHLHTEETRAYAREIGRLLKPGGRCFLSLFLMNDEARDGLRGKRGRLPFDPEAPGPEYHGDPGHPAGAVAYDETFLMDLFAGYGLQPGRPCAYGHWSGRHSANFQDLCLLRKGSPRA